MFLTYNLDTAADELTFTSAKTIVLFIHGWLQSPQKPAVQTLIESYISNDKFIILILDWSQAASSDLVTVSSRVQGVR